jgi:hypothetical protein
MRNLSIVSYHINEFFSVKIYELIFLGYIKAYKTSQMSEETCFNLLPLMCKC